MNKRLLLNGLCLLLVGHASAQLALDLTYDDSTAVFTVAVVSQESYTAPKNTTGTAQVTLLAPTGTWELLTFENATDGQFELNATALAPEENPTVDYFSFGLTNGGTTAIPYGAGTPTPLFRFTLADPCAGPITLFDTATDPFAPPNSRTMNVGNDLAVLGAAQYGPVGRTEHHTVDCGQVISSDETPEMEVTALRLFPNPVVEVVHVELHWDAATQPATLRTVDAAGKSVATERRTLTPGTHRWTLPARTLAPGMYFLQLTTHDGQTRRLGSFVRG